MDERGRTLGLNGFKRSFLPPWLPPFLAVALTIVMIGAVGTAFWLEGDLLQAAHFMEVGALILDAPKVLGMGLAWNLFLAGAFWLIFMGLGSWTADRLRLSGMSPLERSLISAGLGAGALSLLLLGLGVAGLWKPGQLRLLFLILLVVSPWALFTRSKGDGVLPQEPPRLRDSLGFQGLALALIFLAAIVNVLATSGPEISFDSLVYHLALPKLYLLRGAVVPTPENMYSGIPFGIEMLYGLALAVSNEHLAALLHCSFGIAAALALWAWMRRHASSEAGIFAVLLFYLCPIVLFTSWQCGVEMGMSFYLSLALHAIVRAQDPGERRLSWAAAAGLLLGFAMGVKYTAVPLAGAMVLAFWWMSRRAGGSSAEAGRMALAAGLAFLPWLIKNFGFYGNPVYPFLNSLLGSVHPGNWDGFLSDARLPTLRLGLAAGWKDTLLLPWEISVTNRSTDNWLGAALILFLPTALSLRWGIAKKRADIPAAWTAAAVFGAAAFLVWFFSSRIVRFLSIAVPFFAVAASLAVLHGRFPLWLRRVAWTAALAASLHHFQVVFRTGEGWASGRWPAVRGLTDRGAYLKEQHTTYGVPYYSAMEFIDRSLPREAKVMFLGEFRSYYCQRDFIAASIFDHNPFWVAARNSHSGDELAAALRAMGVTHIFLSPFQCYFHAEAATVFPRDVVSGGIFGDFWSRWLDGEFEEMRRDDAKGVYSWLVVYRLRPRPRATPDPAFLSPWRSVIASLRQEGRWQQPTAW